MVDSDMNVSIPQKLAFDLYISMHVAPRPDESLTHEFNVPANFSPAGQPAEPLVIPYKSVASGEKKVFLTVTAMRDGVPLTHSPAVGSFSVDGEEGFNLDDLIRPSGTGPDLGLF
jgi:hypothetical protein